MIAIKNMEMPKYCYECPCNIQCKLIDTINRERPSDCLLEEINMPIRAINVESVKHGYWIVHKLGYSNNYYFECSHCHADDIYGEEYEDECDFEYCPHCGARMDLDEVIEDE